MIRALCSVLALAACTPKPAPTRPHDDTQEPAAIEPDAGTPAAVDAPMADAPVESVDAPPVTPPPPMSPPVPAGTAAYCLYVGAEQRVVRCYWQKKLCDQQIAFNTETGLDKSQECRGVAEAHCFVSDKSERCYPTADECGHTVAGIRERSRQATDCVAKTHP
jgi:hypothetical protein